MNDDVGMWLEMPTHWCARCGAAIVFRRPYGWVDVVDGDEGGTHEWCPEDDYSDDCSQPHVPGDRVPADLACDAPFA
jgi:hypothetical protein